MPDYRDYAIGAARRNGVPTEMFERQIAQESGFRPDAYNAGSGATGIAQIIKRWHPDVDPTDPIASLDYAAEMMAGYRRQTGSWAKALAAYNWGIGNVLGYTKTDGTVVPPWDGRRDSLPAETRHYLDVILGEGWPEPNIAESPNPPGQVVVSPPRLQFDPNTPDEKQRQDWTCAVRSTMWLLKSIGVDVTPDEAQDAMSPRYVTPELGLLDATGAGIVQVLRDRWGVDAENHATVTFDQVASWAGRMPVAIGGRNWGGPGRGHWSAVRGYDGTRLLLANPASGTVYGDASLTREQWAWRGPWSAVTVPLAEQQPSLPVPDELADLRRRLNDAVSALGYASGDVAEAADAIAQAATALASTLRSLRPPAA